MVHLELPDSASPPPSSSRLAPARHRSCGTPSRRCGGTSSATSAPTASSAAGRASSRRCGSPTTEGRVRPHEQTHATAKAGRLELHPRRRREPLADLRALRRPHEHAARRAAPTATGAPDMQAIDSDGTDAPLLAGDGRRGDRGRPGGAWPTARSLIADGHHRYETALAYRDERRDRDGDPGGRPALRLRADVPRQPAAARGCRSIPPTAWSSAAARSTDEVLHAFDVSELDAPPAQVEAALGLVPADTVAFAVWRGAERPALLCKLRDRAAVMHGDAGRTDGAARDRRGRARGARARAAAGPRRPSS